MRISSGAFPSGGMKKIGRKLLTFLLITLTLWGTGITALATDEGTWTMKAPMAIVRSQFAVEAINGKIYAMGGYSSGVYSNSVEEYNPLTNTWMTKASMATARGFARTAVIDGKIYVTGGNNQSVGTDGYLDSVEEYDPATDTWTTKASMSTKRHFHEVAVIDGTLYAVGGNNGVPSSGVGYLNSVEAYDPATDTWTSKASMTVARDEFAVAVVNGKIYAMGGKNQNSSLALSSVEEYDPTTNIWTTKSSMSATRSSPKVAVVDGKIYAIGGNSSTSGITDSLDSIEEYDPATNTWTTKTPMSTKRMSHEVAVVDGKIYAIGGLPGTYPALDSVEAYDPTTDTWTMKASMAIEKRNFKVAVINEKIYAMVSSGGVNYVEEYSLQSIPPQPTPQVPANLTATAGDSQVNLSWAAAADAVSYNVLRSTTAGGPYSVIAGGITSTAYTDPDVTNGTTYYYVVTAVNGENESGYSNEASATPQATDSGRALLSIKMIGGAEREYDLTMEEVNAFVNWYDARANGAGKMYYVFDNNVIGPFVTRQDYIVFDKIIDFEIMRYE